MEKIIDSQIISWSQLLEIELNKIKRNQLNIKYEGWMIDDERTGTDR